MSGVSEVTTRRAERALARLARPRAVLALTRDGLRFGVFDTGDQRRRPGPIVSRATVMQWLQDGLVRRETRGLYRLNRGPEPEA